MMGYNIPAAARILRQGTGRGISKLEESPMITITKDTIIGDILDIAPHTAPIFLSIGMHCLGCPSSRGETVEQACMVHGVDVDELLAKVNAMIPAAQ